MPKQYAVIRTNKARARELFAHFQQGTLRQGWGHHPRQNLHRIQTKRATNNPLDEHERAAWGNRRLLASEPKGLQPGDIILCPHLPSYGQWLLARVSGPYHYDDTPLDNDDQYHRHCLPIDPIRTPSGEVARINPRNPRVDARLRATMRTPRRMWAIDHLGDAIETLIAAIQAGADLSTAETRAERANTFRRDARAMLTRGTWEALQKHYQAAELEHLLVDILNETYGGHAKVEHRGGPNEQGADILVTVRAPLGLEFRVPIQVKMYDGVLADLHVIEQLRRAHETYGADMLVLLTTATEVSAKFEEQRQALMEELNVKVEVWTREQVANLIFAHLSNNPEDDEA